MSIGAYISIKVEFSLPMPTNIRTWKPSENVCFLHEYSLIQFKMLDPQNIEMMKTYM